MEKCEDCKWWVVIGNRINGKFVPNKDGTNRIGWCRVNPPLYSEKNIPDWPKSYDSDKCSKYAPELSELDRAENAMMEFRELFLLKKHVIEILNKKIRDAGETHGISRKKQPIQILDLLKK